MTEALLKSLKIKLGFCLRNRSEKDEKNIFFKKANGTDIKANMTLFSGQK